MKILKDIVIGGILITALLFVYQTYGDSVKGIFFGDGTVVTVYINAVALSVSVADSDTKRQQGLSGVTSLGEFEGKLFVFDSAQKHGIWMKDMLFPIDIMWFDDNLELIYTQKSVDPSTFPTIFIPTENARFVIETNANFIDALNIKISDKLLLPAAVLPEDIRKNL